MNSQGPFEAGSKLAAYLRDSGGSEQELSTLQQEAELRGWAEKNGYILTRVFADVARTGATVNGRAAFEEMIRYFRAGASGEVGIVIWKYSRFTRDFDDAQFYKADLRRRGFEIYSLTDSVSSGPEGRLMESIIEWMNQRYREDMSIDIKRGKRYLVVTYHAWPGGHPPAGYKFVKGQAGYHRNGAPRIISRIEPDEAMAPLVRQAFRMRAEGATLPEVLRAAPGIVSSVPSLGRVLKNKIYIGVMEYDGLEIPDFSAPLIDLPTWAAAQDVNAHRIERHGYDHPRRVRSRFVLTGLLHCARCGRPMHGRTIQRKPYRSYDYYRCGSENVGQACGAQLLPKNRIEDLVIERVKERVLQPGILSALAEEVAAAQSDGSQQADELIGKYEADLQDAGARIERLVAAITAAGHSRALIVELGQQELRQQAARAKLAELQALQAIRPLVEAAGMDDLAAEARRALESDNPLDRAGVLRGFIREIRAERLLDGEIVGDVVFYVPGGKGVRDFVVSL